MLVILYFITVIDAFLLLKKLSSLMNWKVGTISNKDKRIFRERRYFVEKAWILFVLGFFVLYALYSFFIGYQDTYIFDYKGDTMYGFDAIEKNLTLFVLYFIQILVVFVVEILHIVVLWLSKRKIERTIENCK